MFSNEKAVSSVNMSCSESQNVYQFSKENKHQVEFKNNEFHFTEHHSNVSSISLNSKELATLLKIMEPTRKQAKEMFTYLSIKDPNGVHLVKSISTISKHLQFHVKTCNGIELENSLRFRNYKIPCFDIDCDLLCKFYIECLS